MSRCLGLLFFAMAACAEDRPPSDLQILKWQVEAQARERAVTRHIECQIENAQPRAKEVVEAGGIEPPSEKVRTEETTCVSGS